MSFGELFEKLVDWVVELWPIKIINDWESGVLVRLGQIQGVRTSKTGWFGTGFHVILPIVYDLMVEDSNIEAQISPRLDFMTNDEEAVSGRFSFQYVISDISLMWRAIHDYEDTVLTAICTEVVQAAMKIDYEELEDRLCENALKRCHENLSSWGIDVRHIGIASLSAVQTIRLIGEQPEIIG